MISFGLAVLLVIKYDPIGLGALSEAYSEGVFYRVVGASKFLTNWLYQSPQHESDFGQKNSAMVLVDDKDLEAIDSTWPVPFGLHNRVISSILTYKPKAIFVDISFTDARNDPSLHEFANTIKLAHQSNIPIYFASLNPFHQQNKILPELAKACARVIPAYRDIASIDGVEHGYILKHPSPVESAATEFEKECGFAGQAIIDSPALALYREYLGAQQVKLNDKKFDTPMEVFWAVGDVNPVTARLLTCERKTFSNVSPFNISKLFNGATFEAIKQNCPHTPTINVRDLLATSPNDEEAKEMFSGNLVIYAAHISGSGDVIVSPTHAGRVPAAYLHSMALDNLLVLGEGYKKVSEMLEIILLAIFFVFFGYLSITKKHEPPKRYKEFQFAGRPKKWSNFCLGLIQGFFYFIGKKLRLLTGLLVIHFIFAFIIFIICLLFFYFCDVAPLNWIKFIGFSITFEVIESRLKNSQQIHRLFNWLAKLSKET